MRLRTFLRTLFLSVTTPKYYIDVLNAKLSFSVRFLLMSYLVFSIVVGLFFAAVEVPRYSSHLHTYLDQQIQAFPEEKQITWNGQNFTANFDETLALPFPKLPDDRETPPLLLQFNPQVKSIADISEHSVQPSLLFIGESRVFVAQPDKTWFERSIADLFGRELSQNQLFITQQSVRDNTTRLHQQLQNGLRLASIVFPFFFFFSSLLFRSINAFLDTLLIYVTVRLLRMPLDFKKVLQLNLHVMVVAELVSLLTLPFNTTLQMYAITFWLYIVMIYWQLRNVKILPLSVLFGQVKDQD